MGKTSYISIDLGTVNTRIYVKDRGIVFNETTILAYNTKLKKIISIGNQAYELLGKENKNIVLIRPLNNSGISDVEVTKLFLKIAFKKTKIEKLIKKSILVFNSPSSTSELEKISLKEIANFLKPKKIIVENDAKMVAFSKLPINTVNPEGHLVVDIGGGTTTCAVFCFGDVTLSRSINTAGFHITKEIQKYLRTNYDIIVGEVTAENLKKTFGTLRKDVFEETMIIYGINIINRMPKKINVTNQEIYDVIAPFYKNIAHLVAQTLEATDPELVSDIFRNGIYLAGGGALVDGIKAYFQNIFKIPVIVASNPLLSVIEGTKVLENMIDYDNDQ